jgi:signal transduction histidine kinase
MISVSGIWIISELITIAIAVAVILILRRRKGLDFDPRGRVKMLIRGLAHEIRNPLNSLNAHLQLLQEDIASDERLKDGEEYLGRIEKIRGEVQRLNRILSDFLRYMRLPDPELAPTDLSSLVGEVLDFIEPESRRLGVELVREIDPVPQVMADAAQVKQALLNLILNAHDAMPDGGKMIVSVKPEGRFVRVDVSDTGAGIPSETIDRIFEPFYSTKGEGTGLGLSMVKQIMDNHAGKVRVVSEQGKGTTASLFFPVR